MFQVSGGNDNLQHIQVLPIQSGGGAGGQQIVLQQAGGQAQVIQTADGQTLLYQPVQVRFWHKIKSETIDMQQKLDRFGVFAIIRS